MLALFKVFIHLNVANERIITLPAVCGKGTTSFTIAVVGKFDFILVFQNYSIKRYRLMSGHTSTQSRIVKKNILIPT